MKIASDDPGNATHWSIAEQVGVDRATVAKRRTRPEYLAMYLERNLPASEILRNAKTKAAKRLVEALDATQFVGGGKESEPVEVADQKTRVIASKAVLGPELVGPDGGGNPQAIAGITFTGEAAAGLLRYFGSLHRGAMPEGGPRTP